MMEKHARIEALRDRLVSEAEERLEKPPSRVPITEDYAADELLNDLQVHPHAFVIACIMDRQDTASVAWAIPCKLGQRLAYMGRLTAQRIDRSQVPGVQGSRAEDRGHGRQNPRPRLQGARVRQILHRHL